MDEEERKRAEKEEMEEKDEGEEGSRVNWEGLPRGGLLVQRIGRQKMLQVNLNGLLFQVSQTGVRVGMSHGREVVCMICVQYK